MSTVKVTVLDDGSVQPVVDGVMWAPVPLEAVQAMAAKLPDAQAAAERQNLTAAIRTLTGILVASGPGMAATVSVNATALTATVDAASFALAQQMTGVSPDANGNLVVGPVTIAPSAAAPAS